ncbi:MAG TPA: twin-arginine translocase TatA/TatE family subunit [Acidimicrobiales bacterium]|nr:twin-arginine translocase TatA/TatE family subunit [Acidimicrobiales bacterium]
MLSFGPAKILIVLMVALIVLGPDKLPQMTRQVGKAWGDFRRFREHLEDEVRGALGEDLVQPFTPPWHVTGSSDAPSPSAVDGATADGAAPEGATTPDGSASGEGAQDRAPPQHPGQLAPLPPATGSAPSAAHGGWDPGLAPDDPSLN